MLGSEGHMYGEVERRNLALTASERDSSGPILHCPGVMLLVSLPVLCYILSLAADRTGQAGCNGELETDTEGMNVPKAQVLTEQSHCNFIFPKKSQAFHLITWNSCHS